MPTPTLTPGPGESYDVTQKPPPFGHALKHYFAFDEDYVSLNHGSYGSLPLPVIFATNKLTYEIEAYPDMFLRITYKPLHEKSRAAIAQLIGADADEIVLCPNATHALNTVLRNFEWREGDLLIGASTTYGAVSKTIRYIADRSEQPRPIGLTIDYKFPLTHAQIIDIFRSRLREFKQQYANTPFTDVPSISPEHTADPAQNGNKIVVVIDSITANPGVLMPWQEMVRIAHEEGAWAVIDGAHSIGQEQNINLTEAKPDFWLSNCHKWLYAKRGCAALYVPKRNQHIIKSSIPTSHDYISPSDPKFPSLGTKFVLQHEWTGTMNLTPYLSVPHAIAFREWLGGEKAIYEYCHQLAMDGAKRLAEVMGTCVMDETGELTATMSNVLLPLPVEKTPGEVYKSYEQAVEIYAYTQDKLLNEWKTYAAHYYHNGGWWVRCSAQVWNEVSDFEYLGKALIAISKEIEENILSKNAA